MYREILSTNIERYVKKWARRSFVFNLKYKLLRYGYSIPSLVSISQFILSLDAHKSTQEQNKKRKKKQPNQINQSNKQTNKQKPS